MYSIYGTGWLFLCHPPRPLSNKMKKLMLVTLLKLCFPYLKIHHVPSQLAVRFTFHVWLLKNGWISGRRKFLNGLWPPSFQETRLQLCVNMRKFATKCFGLKTTPTLSDICSKEKIQTRPARRSPSHTIWTNTALSRWKLSQKLVGTLYMFDCVCWIAFWPKTPF